MAMQGSSQRNLFAGLCLMLVCQIGCAAFRPVHGVPARYLPAEMKAGDRSNRRTIDLSLLRQAPPAAHLIDTGDVLGVYVEGFVGKVTDPPPVHFPLNNESAPSFGFPHPVREDGTISLPQIGSVYLRGLTVVQAEEKVKQAYFSPRELLNKDNFRVQVNLQRPRQYRVLVIRQDSQNQLQPTSGVGQLNIGMVRRGTGKVVNLPAYSNDVLNALTATEGLPGLDAENAVYVIRRRGRFTGGTLDPRWPSDLNPALMMNPAGNEGPVIRGQSMDGDSGYLHSPQTQPIRYPSGIQMVSHSYPPGIDDVPLAPPKIWDDRSSVSPIAFDPSAGMGMAGQPYPGPTPLDPRSMNGAVPPNGSGWNDAMVQYPRMYGAPNPNVQPGPPGSNGAGWNDPVVTYPNMYGAPNPNGQPGPAGAPPAYNMPMNPAYPNQISSGYNVQTFDQRQSYDTRNPNVMQPVNSGAPPTGGPVYGMPNSAAPADPYQWNQSVGNGPTPVAPPSGPAPSIGPVDPGMLGIGPDGTLDGRHVIRIPIRLGPGETADIRPEDVVLYDGDIIFIESRDTEVFYTGGLLGGGQYTIPRDYDLDILQAISLATSRGNVGGVSRSVGGVSALNNDVAISPSTAIVLRKLPDGGEVPVKVDLYRARTDLSERIIIQPGDYLLLQYTPLEAIAAFFERHLLETALFAVATQAFNGNGN